MGKSFGTRPDHLMPFMTWAEIINIDPRDIYQLSWINCLEDPYEPSCGVSWTEYDWQVENRPSRMTLAQRLFEAEMMIGNYLKTPVGPTYVKNEMHTLRFMPKQHRRRGYYNGHTNGYDGPDLRITTRYRNVLRTGTQVLTPIGHHLPQTRTFEDRKGWGFTDDIVYCIGNGSDPLLMDDLLTPNGDTGIVTDNLCNLRLYQPGWGPISDSCIPVVDAEGNICYEDSWTNQDSEFYHGHRIRPFHATYDGVSLCIQVNKTPNVKIELYSKVPQGPKSLVKDLDFCDEDNYPEQMMVYNVSYEKPDGVAYLRKQPCACTYGCDACQMREVPICLEVIDPINGEFRVIPIVEIEDPDDPDQCCWQQTTWSQCCWDLYGDYNACGCDIPIVVCINYVASACGNWHDCCLPDEVCPDLAPSVAYLATGMFPSACSCGCFDDIFQHYQMDMMIALAERRSGSMIYAAESSFQIFGSTRGAYEAYQRIRYRHRVHDHGDWFIG